MNLNQEAREWWLRALLGQTKSAHPIFGRGIRVSVDGRVVTLTGVVGSPDEAQQAEQEALAVDMVEQVINHLRVVGESETYHRQTVLAVFPDCRSAQVAQQAMVAWTFHDDQPPELFERAEDARPYLLDLTRKAHVPEDAVNGYLRAMQKDGVLVVDTVPEDDALRIISALEGTHAQKVGTLPPEPGAVLDE